MKSKNTKRQIINNSFSHIRLTSEQEKFVKLSLLGKNILVDACIGSGKTTTIQYLCNLIPKEKNVLYLTYNYLLKVDAQEKINKENVHVQNYHGFAAEILCQNGIDVARDDLINRFNREKFKIPKFDLLIVDEYQDIDSQSAEMLRYIKKCNPNIQIIMVGDFQQKIYNYTSLDINKFVKNFLCEHLSLKFSTCFRLSKKWAKELSKTWNKKINGVNPNCKIEYMSFDEVVNFLIKEKPGDILCLGQRTSGKSYTYGDLLNKLEQIDPEKFNKNTVYASIRDKEANIRPKKDCAIFTTYDSSKGLEKKICVLLNWTKSYWNDRCKHEFQQYDILRNIFCVAASRGKEKIIIVKDNDQLTWPIIRTKFDTKTNLSKPLSISDIFNFAKTEYLDECYSCLQCRPIISKYDQSTIDITRSDGLIDLSPCIGIYQEACYFKNYDIDKQIEHVCSLKKITPLINSECPLAEKILYLTSIETGQHRYFKQVNKNFISNKQWKEIKDRIGQYLTEEEHVQEPCKIECFTNKNNKIYMAVGLADVIKNNVVYELKFTSELSHANFLQCATYMVALKLEKGILWNVYKNEIYEITIPNKVLFLNNLTKLITNGICEDYIGPLNEYYNKEVEITNKLSPRNHTNYYKKFIDERIEIINNISESDSIHSSRKLFAVIDTETTWNDPNRLKYGTKYLDKVISIGIVIAEEDTYKIRKTAYFIIEPECIEQSLYMNKLELAPIQITKRCSREESICDIHKILSEYQVENIFAYNANFDYLHLPELAGYKWHDIMKKAAYSMYNPFLSKYYSPDDFCKTGRLKKGYGVENICALLKENPQFAETHCAIFDSMDELFIMKKIRQPLENYPILNKKL